MKLARIVSRFYSKCFIGISAVRGEIHVGVLNVSSSGEESVDRRVFAEGMLSEELMAYLQEAVSQTPFNYIAVLADVQGCGALPTCSFSKAKEMAPAVAQSETVCVDTEWMNYMAHEALNDAVQFFQPFETDAVYSPFALLHTLYEEQMGGAHALFILLTPLSVSLCVVKERHLRIAEYFYCLDGPEVSEAVPSIIGLLESYYGKPCCRGEFIESVFVADGVGDGEALSHALDDLLLLETDCRQVEPALLAANTCRKEAGFGL